MTSPNKRLDSLGIFIGANQKDAHEVLADLYCKHVRPDADQGKVLQLLDSDEDFDPEIYEHIICETGAELFDLMRDATRKYVDATLAQEQLNKFQKTTKNHANSNNRTLSSAYAHASRWVKQNEAEVKDTQDIMDIVEKDLMDFRIACLAVEGQRKEIASKELDRMQKQNVNRIMEDMVPRTLRIAGPE